MLIDLFEKQQRSVLDPFGMKDHPHPTNYHEFPDFHRKYDQPAGTFAFHHWFFDAKQHSAVANWFHPDDRERMETLLGLLMSLLQIYRQHLRDVVLHLAFQEICQQDIPNADEAGEQCLTLAEAETAYCRLVPTCRESLKPFFCLYRWTFDRRVEKKAALTAMERMGFWPARTANIERNELFCMAGESLNKVVRSCFEPNRDYGPAHGLGFRRGVILGTTFTIQNNVTGVRGKQYKRLCAMARAIPMRASDSRGATYQVSFEREQREGYRNLLRDNQSEICLCYRYASAFCGISVPDGKSLGCESVGPSERFGLNVSLFCLANSETNSLGFGPSSH